jgi:hypothetical protein
VSGKPWPSYNFCGNSCRASVHGRPRMQFPRSINNYKAIYLRKCRNYTREDEELGSNDQNYCPAISSSMNPSFERAIHLKSR